MAFLVVAEVEIYLCGLGSSAKSLAANITASEGRRG